MIRPFIPLLVLLMLFIAHSADARIERLRWTDPDNAAGTVTSFKVYFGTTTQSYSGSVVVGIPPQINGAYQSDVTMSIPDNVDAFIAVTAVNGASLESIFSNERCRTWEHVPCGATPPPPPPPPPAPPVLQSKIEGFKLWNAETDTIIDADFRTGESITYEQSRCAAIEIIGNAYLNKTGTSPGSIEKTFDSGTKTFENVYPYAFELDSGVNKFACSGKLQVAGEHRLVVRSFDGNNGAGEVSAPITLTFTVMPPPRPEPPVLEASIVPEPELVGITIATMAVIAVIQMVGGGDDE